MKSKKMEYMEMDGNKNKLVKTEILLTPLLLILPIIVGILFVYDWFYRDFLNNSLELEGELTIGIIILLFNLLFDIPFIKSLRKS
ncbi:MAG: hypothetical protein JSW62_04210 [Thermoplasmatales archaeon]|nr:MAG: hypothetical protein JSW62_04210 [Thermoplasmatales archaeon]